MKKLIYIVLCLLAILSVSCNSSPKIYPYDEVQKDSSGVWVFKKNGKKVNGIVERNTKHLIFNEPIVHHIDIVDGISVGSKDYFDDECIGHIEYENGQITGTYYGIRGNKTYTLTLKDGKADGLYKVFEPSGKQIYEAVFEDGISVKSYDFDSNGNKIIPIEEKLELVAYRTGFFESVDSRYNELLYCPIVIMKFKNISDLPIDDKDIKITATFLNNDEEWSSDHKYLIGYSDSPLSPGISKQCYLLSSVGYTSFYSIGSANIECQLFINGKPYKTVKISNELRTSNRM